MLSTLMPPRLAVTPAAYPAHAMMPVVKRPRRADRLRVSTLLTEGPAAASIVRAAKRNRVGLIVLGTHGRGGVARMVLGSVAEQVVRMAHCPVLTVRARRV